MHTFFTHIYKNMCKNDVYKSSMIKSHIFGNTEKQQYYKCAIMIPCGIKYFLDSSLHLKTLINRKCNSRIFSYVHKIKAFYSLNIIAFNLHKIFCISITYRKLFNVSKNYCFDYYPFFFHYLKLRY